MRQHFLFLVTTIIATYANSFMFANLRIKQCRFTAEHSPSTFLSMGEQNNDDLNEIIAARLIVEGDVNGGYYRSCLRNEV